jgi:SAM-dependent methyltransferase
VQSEWETFFDGHAPVFMQVVSTRDTPREVDFLFELLGLQPETEVLDLGCGAGRHSIELARRGSVQVRERGYLPSQLVALLQETGSVVKHLRGGTAGRSGRRPLELDEIEVMAVSLRPE